MKSIKRLGFLGLSIVFLPLLTGAEGGGCNDPVPIGGDDPSGGEGGGGNGAGGPAGSGGHSADPGCNDFRSEASNSQLIVTVRNERATPIYLGAVGACGTPIVFSVHKDGGPEIARSDNLEPERNTTNICDQPFAPSLPNCTGLPTIRIEPGGHYEGSWSGLVYNKVTPPAACDFPGREGDGSCFYVTAAPESAYQIESEVHLEARGCDGSACACPVGSTGGACVLGTDNEVLGEPIRATATVNFPSEVSAEIVFR